MDGKRSFGRDFFLRNFHHSGKRSGSFPTVLVSCTSGMKKASIGRTQKFSFDGF